MKDSAAARPRWSMRCASKRFSRARRCGRVSCTSLTWRAIPRPPEPMRGPARSRVATSAGSMPYRISAAYGRLWMQCGLLSWRNVGHPGGNENLVQVLSLGIADVMGLAGSVYVLPRSYTAWTCFLPGHFWDWWFWKDVIWSMLFLGSCLQAQVRTLPGFAQSSRWVSLFAIFSFQSRATRSGRTSCVCNIDGRSACRCADRWATGFGKSAATSRATGLPACCSASQGTGSWRFTASSRRRRLLDFDLALARRRKREFEQ